jgi:hypothetical protein
MKEEQWNNYVERRRHGLLELGSIYFIVRLSQMSYGPAIAFGLI